MPTEEHYAVDSIENELAVLVNDSGDTATVPLVKLPASLSEGAVLRVPTSQTGELDWPGARIDAEETRRRFEQAEQALRELRQRDPGGDIEL
jgi:hypothetical protein